MNIMLFLYLVLSPWTPYHHAEIQSYDKEVATVQTKGEEPWEGVVQTQHKMAGRTSYSLDVMVRGEGNVIMKIHEFDQSGNMVKEKVTDPLMLSDQWKGGRISFTTHPLTKGIHVFLLQTDKEPAHFEIRDLDVKEVP